MIISRIGLLLTVRAEVDFYVEKYVILVEQTVLDTVNKQSWILSLCLWVLVDQRAIS
jgi:hypothetical protein